MITLEKMAYDIRHLLNKLNLTDTINDAHIYDKIIHYIELVKKKEYDDKKVIDPSWIMHLGKVDAVAANSGDDVNVTNGSVVFSKIVIPKPMMFGKNPYVRVSSGLRTIEFSKIETMDLFYQIYRGDREVLERNPVYVMIGNAIYGYPFKLGLSISLVPSDPRDCYIRKALTPPYGNITSYTATELRKFTIWDELPISGDLAQIVISEIVNKDFAKNREDEIDNTQNGTAEN